MDPFAQFKEAQKQGWAHFAPLETFTTPTAARLVNHARVVAGQRVLDVACGTGVVAITAARVGARVTTLDFTPQYLNAHASTPSLPASMLTSARATPSGFPSTTERLTWCSASTDTSSPPGPSWSSVRCFEC
jgi:hypothetical protein